MHANFAQTTLRHKYSWPNEKTLRVTMQELFRQYKTTLPRVITVIISADILTEVFIVSTKGRTKHF